jgi:methionyl-tRNA formyltransferase
MGKKRIILLGRGNLGAFCFCALNNLLFDVCGIVSNTKGTGHNEPLLYYTAMRCNIPFISNEERNEDKIWQLIWDKKVDYLLSIQHIWVLSEELLDMVKGAYNLHNAKLPEYKGYYSISHAILNGDKTYISTIHHMAPKVDSGDIICEIETPIDDNDTALSLYEKTMKNCEILVDRFLTRLANYDGPEIDTLPRKEIIGEGKFYNKASLDKYKVLTPDKITKTIVCAMYFPPQTARVKIGEDTYAISL